MSTGHRSVPWLAPAAIISTLVFAWFAKDIWNKYDWCSGWSQHYADTAARYRLEAQDPTKSIEERSDLLIAAEWHDTISAKYARVASRPWLRYPAAPLLTETEKQAGWSRTEAARAALTP